MNEQCDECDHQSANAAERHLPVITSRLVLRLPEPMDARQFAEVANNMAIASQMSGLPHPYSEKNAESWIAATHANTNPHKLAILITLNDGTVAGGASVSPNENGEPEINFFLGETHWGKGLATEAAQGIIDLTFAALDIDRIVGRCGAVNRGSKRVLEKCGFQFSRTGMTNCVALNSSVACEEFVLERSIWESLKKWGGAA